MRPGDVDLARTERDRRLVLEGAARVARELRVRPHAGCRIAAQELHAAERAVVRVEEERRVVDDSGAIDRQARVPGGSVLPVREDVDGPVVVPGDSVVGPVKASCPCAVPRVVVVRPATNGVPFVAIAGSLTGMRPTQSVAEFVPPGAQETGAAGADRARRPWISAFARPRT